MDVLKNSLLARYRKRQLAHFYLLQSSDETQLKNWARDFIVSVLSDEGQARTDSERRLDQGHPDILWLTPQENAYKIQNGDFDPLFQAMAHKPLEIPWRFIVVEKPETIGDVYANKLLKTLEEPAEACTIIFLHRATHSLMQTIESRAIKLRLPSSDKTTLPQPKNDQPLGDFIKDWGQSFSELYESALELPSTGAPLITELAALSRSRPDIEENLVLAITTWAHHNITNAQTLEKVLNASKHSLLSRTVNNGPAERFMTLISSVDN